MTLHPQNILAISLCRSPPLCLIFLLWIFIRTATTIIYRIHFLFSPLVFLDHGDYRYTLVLVEFNSSTALLSLQR